MLALLKYAYIKVKIKQVETEFSQLSLMFLSSRFLQGNHDRDGLIVKKLIASGVVVIYMTPMWSLVRIERKGGPRASPI